MPLSLRAWVDQTSIRPDGAASLRLVVELEAHGDSAEIERPGAVTMLAIDVSGSMQGAPLDHVIRSVDFILAALRPVDRVGVVTFSDDAAHVVGPVTVDANGKRLVKMCVSRLEASGNTNVEAGLELAAKHALVVGKGGDGEGRRGLVLLSDGVPNRGATSVEALREIAARSRAAVTISALGYGIEHSEDTLSAIGEAGGGGYEFVQDPSACARAFAKALGAQADVVASAIELVIAPAEGVEIGKLLGREESRFGRDGITVVVPDMTPGATRLVVAELAVAAPGAERFLASLASLRLRWRAPGSPAHDELREDVAIEIAAREPAPVMEACARVMLVRADAARVEARALADRRNFRAAGVMLRALLAEILATPGFVSGSATPLGEAYELVLDEATAMERVPTEAEYKQFRKATIAAKLSAQEVQPMSRGPASSRMLDLAAGKFPEAYVVVVKGPAVGARYRLREECSIGRSASAEIPISSDSISRRHATIYALEGEFWVTDLGSTNTTELDGKRLTAAPAKLAPGAVLRVGDVELRYEEVRVAEKQKPSEPTD